MEEVADVEIFGDDLRRINNSAGGTRSGALDLECLKFKPSSLATCLFDNFGTCPYCGGKFIDYLGGYIPGTLRD